MKTKMETVEISYVDEEIAKEEIRKARKYRKMIRQNRPIVWGLLATLILTLMAVRILPPGYILFFLIFLSATTLEIIWDNTNRKS